ncbi:hypothetical protein [Marinimicrobium sp. ABcell2]|uniref:hypothetical protein n=1 Tax=Marinimicrobium sp. ABcell2 TaxID=3069751 RepID=UPI0027AFED9D|nr:hypothetical protein [Marinimicrobium sp. ABcell2]MDQ2077889.1 hypothetical protein [Marinimicrobium sp. ABcell2]
MKTNYPGPPPACAYRVVAGLAALLILAAAAVPPIQQPADYNIWADQRQFLGIPHIGDVLTNLAFLWVGIVGLRALWEGQCQCAIRGERLAWLLFFTGIILTGFGSAYYHWEPNNFRLVWDRVPMALAFMALFSAVLIERINHTLGLRLLPVLIALAWASVGYWYWTYLQGQDNLAPYLLVQLGPMILIPIILLLFPARYDRGGDYVIALAIYLSAVAAEHLDEPIFQLTGQFISGHNLKHLLAAFAAYWLMRMLQKRKPIESESPMPESVATS